MKKRLISAAIVLFVCSHAAGPSRADVRIRLGLAGDYYAPQDSLYKTFYGGGGPLFQARAGVELSGLIEVSLEAGWFKHAGTMSVSGEGLSLTLTPVAVSARLMPFAVGRFRPFIGAGFGRMSIRERYPERIATYADSAGIALFEVGCYFRLAGRIHAAAAVRYMGAKATSMVQDQAIKLSGLRPSLGFTYTF